MNLIKKIRVATSVISTVETTRRVVKVARLTEEKRQELIDRANAVVEQHLDLIISDLSLKKTFTLEVKGTHFNLFSTMPFEEYMLKGLTANGGTYVAICTEAIYANLLPGQDFEKAVLNILAHELRHVQQFQLGEDVMKGYSRIPLLYDFNKYEVDARAYARKYVSKNK